MPKQPCTPTRPARRSAPTRRASAPATSSSSAAAARSTRRRRRSAARRSRSRPSVVLDNIAAILAAGGAGLEDVVKATVHLADETTFPSSTRSTRAACPSPGRSARRSGAGCARCPECGWRSTSSRTWGEEGAMDRQPTRSSSARGRSEPPPPSGWPSAGSTSCSSTASTSCRRRRRARPGWRRRCRSTTCSPSWPIRGVDALLGFERPHRQPLDVVVNGSVKVARTEDDAEQLREEVAAAASSTCRDRGGRRRGGRDASRRGCNADEARRDQLLADRRLLGGARRAAARVRRGARRLGGRSLANTEVTGFVLDGEASRASRRPAARSRRRSWSTLPARGRAASAGSPTARSRSSRLRHQLCITEPLSEVVPTHPTVRVMDARVIRRARAAAA